MTPKAKYYLYRNLVKGGFSIKHRGKVCARCDVFTMYDVEFKISKAGQDRARNRQQRNVHAFMVSDNYDQHHVSQTGLKNLITSSNEMKEVTYNPYHNDTFIIKETGEPIISADYAICVDGKVYV